MAGLPIYIYVEASRTLAEDAVIIANGRLSTCARSWTGRRARRCRALDVVVEAFDDVAG